MTMDRPRWDPACLRVWDYATRTEAIVRATEIRQVTIDHTSRGCGGTITLTDGQTIHLDRTHLQLVQQWMAEHLPENARALV